MSAGVSCESVAIYLPRSICNQLVETLPSAVPSVTEAQCLERAVLALLEKAQAHRGPDRDLVNRDRDCSEAPPRKRVGPEIHGGIEGSYMRDGATGRWRSLSCAGPRSAQPSAAEADSSSQQPISSEPETAEKRLVIGDSEDSTKHDATTAAKAASARARAETIKLMEAIDATISEPEIIAELKEKENELEIQKRASLLDALRASVDMKTFAAVVRRMSNDTDEVSTLPVGTARLLFEETPGTDTADMLSSNRRGLADVGDAWDISRSRPARRLSRGPLSVKSSHQFDEPTNSTSRATQHDSKRSSSRGSILPPRPLTGTLETTRGARKSMPGFPCGKLTSLDADKKTRDESPSVRHRIMAFEGAKGGA